MELQKYNLKFIKTQFHLKSAEMDSNSVISQVEQLLLGFDRVQVKIRYFVYL